MANPNFSVTIPDNPQESIGLSERVLKKHTLDGGSSVLLALNMADMLAKTTFGKIKDGQGAQMNRDKETAFEARDKALGDDTGTEGTVLFYVASARDILLGIYKGKEHKLGDHGFEVSKSSGNVSVEIPTSAEKLIALADLIIKKHILDGGASPIKGLNMADFSSKNQTAFSQHELATQLNRDNEKANGERDHEYLTSHPMMVGQAEAVRDDVG